MSIQKKWFRSWFDTSYYHILYKNRNDGEAQRFITNLVEYLNIAKDQKILDLACGKGRHSIFLNQLGYDVTGVDLSKQSIDTANTHSNDRLKFAIHDMRTPMKSKFNLVLNMFTSFGYFDTLEDDLMVIMAIKKSLKADGIGVIDFMNIHNVINTLVPQNSVDIDGVNFQIKRAFDGNFIRKSIQVKDGTETYNFEEKVRAYSHEDFKAMLSTNGLQLIDCFGSYDLQAFDPKNSSRLILVFKADA